MRKGPARELAHSVRAKQVVQLKARQLSRQYGFRPSDQDDLAQEIWLYLLRQAHRFDPNRASLPTFVSRVVNTAAAMLVRRRNRVKLVAECQAVSLESTVVEVDGVLTPIREMISEDRRCGAGSGNNALSCDEAVIIDRMMRTMSPHLQEISHRLMSGTITSVARDLDVSRRQVRKAIRSLRWQFQLAKIKNSKKSGHLAAKAHM